MMRADSHDNLGSVMEAAKAMEEQQQQQQQQQHQQRQAEEVTRSVKDVHGGVGDEQTEDGGAPEQSDMGSGVSIKTVIAPRGEENTVSVPSYQQEQCQEEHA